MLISVQGGKKNKNENRKKERREREKGVRVRCMPACKKNETSHSTRGGCIIRIQVRKKKSQVSEHALHFGERI